MEARFVSDRQQWNDFVSVSAYGNITQAYEWGVMLKHAGATPLYIGVFDDQGALCAAMLLSIARMPSLRQTYLYAPRGPVIDDPASPALAVLLDFVKKEADKRGAFMLKVEPQAEASETDWLQVLQKKGFRSSPYFSHIRHEWILDLRPSEKELLAQMKEKWRYNIRLASRKGVTVRRGEGKEDIEIFYRLLQTTSERDQFFIHGVEHVQAMMDLFGQNEGAAIFLAEYEGQAIAGTLLTRFGRTVWYRYGASSSEFRNVMPNHLLQWTGMQWARSQGCWYYNFLGIPNDLTDLEGPKDPLWGVYTFKRGFGGGPRMAMESQELPYNPVIYEVYRRIQAFKHWNEKRRQEKQEKAQERERAVASNSNGAPAPTKVSEGVV